MIRSGDNPFFVTETETGYIVLGDHQFFKGYVLLLCKIHAGELHELEPDFRKKFLRDMAETAAAQYRAFGPKKLNYELLGNGEAHMHWHLFPRYEDDPRPRQPVWTIDEKIRNSDAARPSEAALMEMKVALQNELKKSPGISPGA